MAETVYITQWIKDMLTNMIFSDKEKTNLLLGDREGLTIIGPASVVKKIEKNPDKIELFTKENGTARKKKK